VGELLPQVLGRFPDGCLFSETYDHLCFWIGRRTISWLTSTSSKFSTTTFRRTPFMAQVTLKGTPVQVNGQLPQAGSKAPAFSLVAGNLSEVTLKDFAGKRKVLNIFPSVDTPTCATSVRKFNAQASDVVNTVVLCISADLPFAQARFCGAEGLENVQNLSTLRGAEFIQNYGVAIADGPLKGLTARAVVVLDENDNVLHSELVGEIADEPNYEAALAVLK